MAKWRDIKKLTDEHIAIGDMDHRLIFWNDCNGPHMHSSNDGAFSADQVRREACWTKFLIIPPVPEA
jgi:hypothetical protein